MGVSSPTSLVPHSSSPRVGSCATSRLPVPVHQPPQRTAIRAEVEPLQRLRDGEGCRPRDHGDDGGMVDHEVIHADE